MLSSKEQWEWIRRFADHLVALEPSIWITTATAIAALAVTHDGAMSPEEAAEKFVRDEAERKRRP